MGAKTDLPEKPNAVTTISNEEMDYLSNKYNTSNEVLLGWGVRLLFDLSKLDEKDWKLSLIKCEIEEETKRINMNPLYKMMTFAMNWIRPNKNSFVRLPLPETLDEKFKIEL